MPLEEIFQNQVDQLRAFLDDKRKVVRIVQHDPDLKPVLNKLLTALEGGSDGSHLFWTTGTSFYNQSQYFRDILLELIDANESHRSELAEVGVELSPPSPDGNWAATRGRFVEYLSRVADELPDFLGTYTILIDPDEIHDPRDYEEAIYFLASNTRSKRVKYIVLDQRSKPLLDGFDRHDNRISVQVFRFSPEQVENQLKDDLNHNSSLTASERRQYTALMASFAVSRKDYREAEHLQREVLRESLRVGNPGEQAVAYYNLGNTYISMEEFDLAEDCYKRSGELCIETGSDLLLAMSLTNLGIALHRQGLSADAISSFDSACRIFRATNNHVGTAHSLDHKASVLAETGYKGRAEKAWLEALAIYEGFKGDAFKEVRQAGRQDIIEKLNRFFKRTGQPHKIRNLKRSA
jgi:tetratricopeptide (TPR) repeat protein